MSINRVILVGNVGSSPEIKVVSNNNVASFRVATSEKYTDRNGEAHENTDWHSIVAWGKTAELVGKFVHKGDKIYVEGKIRTREFTTQSGEKRTVTEILADKFEFFPKNGKPSNTAFDNLASDDMPDF